MKQTFPDYFAGFDLVGQEDKGTPLLGFLPQLLAAIDKNIKFFFHSGETGTTFTTIEHNTAKWIKSRCVMKAVFCPFAQIGEEPKLTRI